MALDSDPHHAWLTKNLHLLGGNRDEYVQLIQEPGRVQWRAVDAMQKVMISVYFLPPPDEHPVRGIPYNWLEVRELDKLDSSVPEHYRSPGTLQP